MAFWRSMSLVFCGVLLSLSWTGCTPSSRSTLDEEKEPHYLVGMNRVNAMDYSGAIEAFERSLEVNPHSASAHFQLGLLYERNSADCAAAIYHFEQFLKLRPNSDYAEVVRQRIIGCKQELAKTVSLAPLSKSLQSEFEALTEKNQQLMEENRRLADENRQWRDYFAKLQRQPQGTPLPTLPAPPTTEPPASAPPRTETAGDTSARTHTVQRGETLYSIARRYHVSESALRAANPEVTPTRLRIGYELKLPSP